MSTDDALAQLREAISTAVPDSPDKGMLYQHLNEVQRILSYLLPTQNAGPRPGG